MRIDSHHLWQLNILVTPNIELVNTEPLKGESILGHCPIYLELLIY
jgi:hypothetical protein